MIDGHLRKYIDEHGSDKEAQPLGARKLWSEIFEMGY